MIGRERLNAVLKKKPKDRLPWTTLVDDACLNIFPRELQGNSGIDFYRYLGCDIFMLNGWNTPYQFKNPILRWPDSVVVKSTYENGKNFQQWQTSRGTLTGIRHQMNLLTQSGHPIKYPVDTLEAVTIYREMWEGATFEWYNDTSTLDSINAMIGDNGVVTRFWGPSAIPMLLEEDMGIENFYYLMADFPEEVDGLICTIHEKQLQAFEHLSNGPWDSVTLIENTSTFYISPDIYKQYNMPHQRDFVEIIKGKGKTAILHMCGHVLLLLDLIRETGCDGIHALTPPPTGDTSWEKALDVLGDELIIIGALDPTIFISGPVDGIGKALDRLITPRLREGNFILCPFADGVPVALERFEALKNWFEKQVK